MAFRPALTCWIAWLPVSAPSVLTDASEALGILTRAAAETVWAMLRTGLDRHGVVSYVVRSPAGGRARRGQI